MRGSSFLCPTYLSRPAQLWIGDKLFRSKVPKLQNRRSSRQLKGMKKCFNCVNCPYVSERKAVKSFASKTSLAINIAATCESTNVVYCISCKKCKFQYIGKTERELKLRIAEHRGTIKNKKLD